MSRVTRCWALLAACVLAGGCDIAPEGADEIDSKEDVNLLAAHCVVMAGERPLEIHARVDIEDFGPATGERVETELLFGDGGTSRDDSPRSRITHGSPVKYRTRVRRTYTFARAGTFRVKATVRNGPRVAACAASVTILPPGQTMPHPQG